MRTIVARRRLPPLQHGDFLAQEGIGDGGNIGSRRTSAYAIVRPYKAYRRLYEDLRDAVFALRTGCHGRQLGGDPDRPGKSGVSDGFDHGYSRSVDTDDGLAQSTGGDNIFSKVMAV
ncbi:hypothetical protein MRX96_044258 [Rhipicephalus microplus]